MKYALIAAAGLTAGHMLSRLSCSQANNAKGKNETDYYESRKLLDEYLAMHFGKELDLLQYDFFPAEALEFPQRCAMQCIKYYEVMTCLFLLPNFYLDYWLIFWYLSLQWQDNKPCRALDIGCAVGASSFELARRFDEVVGIDYSQSFVNACNVLKENGRMNYNIITEGDLTKSCVAQIPSDIVGVNSYLDL